MVLVVPNSRSPYPGEFRREAVELVRSGRPVKDVAKGLGCSEQALFTWMKRYQLDHGERDDGLSSDEREELRLLRRKVRRLEEEKEILKRATALFVREPETR
jgi:transposase